jgi:hypothetical protein
MWPGTRWTKALKPINWMNGASSAMMLSARMPQQVMAAFNHPISTAQATLVITENILTLPDTGPFGSPRA